MTLVPLPPSLQALAWALLHFLWQGAALWVLTALALRLARAARPQVRYGLALAALALTLILPIATGWALYAPLLPSAGPRVAEGADLLGAPALGAIAPAFPLQNLLARGLPWVLGLWAAGATVIALRVAGGWLWLQRLKARMEPLEEAWERRLREVARSMGLRGAFRAGLTRDVATPLAIGWIRPVVLLPASLLAGLDPMAVEALLAHEVAHLLRRDALVNGLQCAVEVLLFYHPAVWWLSKRIRLERECCCDDAAVAFTGDALRYAETLDHLDDLQSLNLRTAQAANGANLMYRITRLLTPKARAPRMPFALPLAALLVAGAFALSAHAPAQTPAPQENPTPKAAPKPSKPRIEAKGSPAPEVQPTPAPKGEKGETSHNRSITFLLWVTKANGPKLSLYVDRATQAEVEDALARIESLVEPDTERSTEHGPISGKWRLKPYKGTEDKLLTFQVEQVSPTEARLLYW